MDFNCVQPIVYLSSYHAEERIVDRTGCSRMEAPQKVVEIAESAQLFLEFGPYRYLRSADGNLFLPCILDKYSNNNYTYKVRSVLRWEMVKDRLQRVVDKYASLPA